MAAATIRSATTARKRTKTSFITKAGSTSTIMASLGKNAVRRIRGPNPQDVLCGRGGGVNHHPGNKEFRQFVHSRKHEYNLAESKKDKTTIAIEVVQHVKQQKPTPGRFLTKDRSAPVVGGSGEYWWIEIDDTKAIAKTAQALREGAAKIRAGNDAAMPEPVHSKTDDAEKADGIGERNATVTDGKENKSKTSNTTRGKKRKISNIGSVPCKTPPQSKQNISSSINNNNSNSNSNTVLPLPGQIVSSSSVVAAMDGHSQSVLRPTKVVAGNNGYSIAIDELLNNAKKAKLMFDADEQQRDSNHDDKSGQQQQQQLHHISPVSSNSFVLAPLISNKDFDRLNTSVPSSFDDDDAAFAFAAAKVTPPLMPDQGLDFLDDIPSLQLDSYDDPCTTTTITNTIDAIPSLPSPPQRPMLRRAHSLDFHDDDDNDNDRNCNVVGMMKTATTMDCSDIEYFLSTI